MSQAFAVEETIRAPVSTVWKHLTDWDQVHQWMAGIEWMRADGPTEAGTTLTFRARGKDRPSEIVTANPEERLVLRSVQGGVTAEYVYELEPIDAHTTRASLVAYCRTAGFPWVLIGPIIRPAVKRTDSGQLRALRSVVEGR